METEDIVILLFVAAFLFVVLPAAWQILKIVLIVLGVIAIGVALNYKKVKKEIEKDPDAYFDKQKKEREEEKQ